jgi:hypothetical protein
MLQITDRNRPKRSRRVDYNERRILASWPENHKLRLASWVNGSKPNGWASSLDFDLPTGPTGLNTLNAQAGVRISSGPPSRTVIRIAAKGPRFVDLPRRPDRHGRSTINTRPVSRLQASNAPVRRFCPLRIQTGLAFEVPLAGAILDGNLETSLRGSILDGHISRSPIGQPPSEGPAGYNRHDRDASGQEKLKARTRLA